MKTINKIAAFAAAACMLALGSGCQKEALPETPGGTADKNGVTMEEAVRNAGKMVLHITGSNPGRYGALNLQLMGVAVHYVDRKVGFNGWITVPLRPRIVNVLMHKPGGAHLLASASLPFGAIDNVRLMFGEDNVAVWADKDGRHAMGLTLNSPLTVIPIEGNIRRGARTHITIDFDAMQSLSFEGSDDGSTNVLIFSPVIKSKIDYMP